MATSSHPALTLPSPRGRGKEFPHHPVFLPPLPLGEEGRGGEGFGRAQERIERRLAALFLLALALIAWQAPRTRPLSAPDYVSVLEEGDQVFPMAVPNWEAPEIPQEPVARREFLAAHAVEWSPGAAPASCDLFLRASLHHWVHVSLPPSSLSSLSSLSSFSSFRLLPQDFADDDNADGNPLDPGELRPEGPGAEGAEAEAFCR